MKFAWITDPHLDFCSTTQIFKLYQNIEEKKPQGLFVTGDIGEANTFEKHLRTMAEMFSFPIYVVLGNHDFYRGSISQSRQFAKELCKNYPTLHYMNNAGVIQLTEKTALIGHDGWGDARCGMGEHTPPKLNDTKMIRELTGISQQDVIRWCRNLGDEAAAHFEEVLPQALEKADNVILITHVPPFEEIGVLDPLPKWKPNLVGFFACIAVGNVLLKVMKEHPQKNLLVLCGHAHHLRKKQMLPNLQVICGWADYGMPQMQDMIEIS